jgi:4-aminobutyrate aminotransferase-like enzyme
MIQSLSKRASDSFAAVGGGMSQQSTLAERCGGSAGGAVAAQYRLRAPASAALFDRAAQVLPCGTSGNLRHSQSYPLCFAPVPGTRMTDVDGHVYIDCHLCNDLLLLGHRHSVMVGSLEQHASVGSLAGSPPFAELRQVFACVVYSPSS